MDVFGVYDSSIASENWFSTGGQTIPYARNCLNGIAAQALICFKIWIKALEVAEME